MTRDVRRAREEKPEQRRGPSPQYYKPFVRWIRGPGTADGAGRGCCARRTRATAVNHCRRRMKTQRTVITVTDFSADCRGAAVAKLARNAQGMTDESRIGADRKSHVPAFRTESLETPGPVPPRRRYFVQGKPVLLNVWATGAQPAAPNISTLNNFLRRASGGRAEL